MPEPSSPARPFTMHWGSGQIAEEAAFAGRHKESRIQLMDYTGDAAGSWSVRFCYYSLQGRFQRGPLMMDDGEIEGLREALASTPRLRAILKRLVEEPER